jgi:hypothetical protein
MNRQPHGRVVRVRPFDAMSNMGRDRKIIAWSQNARRRIAFDEERRRTGQQYNPFDLFLIVPEARRTRMSGGDNSLDPRIRKFSEDCDRLLGERGLEIRKEVVGFDQCCLQPRNDVGVQLARAASDRIIPADPQA